MKKAPFRMLFHCNYFATLNLTLTNVDLPNNDLFIIFSALIPKKLPGHHLRRSLVIPLFQIPLHNRPKHSLNHLILNIAICLHLPGHSHRHIFYWLVIQQPMQLATISITMLRLELP